jgi:crotonobetainyl-CoA:carnitine CoA-transferase CaiB-like acyl-CoA transferase
MECRSAVRNVSRVGSEKRIGKGPGMNDTPPSPSSPDHAAAPGTGAEAAPAGPLEGLKVVDLSTVLAGPLCAQILGDYGADVIKVEHPQRGDSFRTHGQARDGHGLWWKTVSRNKRCIGLYLGDPDGAQVFRELVADADVVVENFRPGTLERWGLGWDVLSGINPRLVLVRVTGFGQSGPYRNRPGFGTLAEAMSGFAAITGQPDGPPTLPSMGLADSIAGITASSATMMALWHRDRPGGSGRGQEIDVSLLEPIMCAVGPGPTVWDQLGILQQRNGNRSTSNAPRNTYLTSDGRWLAISTSATPIAERVMRLVGHPEVIDEDWFSSAAGRAEHVELLDGYVADWIGGRTEAEVTAAFEEADAAVAPVYTAADVVADPQVQALDMITTVHDEQLGDIAMNGPLFRMSETPGGIRNTGRSEIGADTDEVLMKELGMDPGRIEELRERGICA